MSLEDPVSTIVRLLQKNMHLVKDDLSLGSVYVSKEWYDQALFKNYDGQVTVGLDHSLDQKLELSGATRRGLGFLKVNVWSSNRNIRQKLRDEINRIIRTKRNRPNETDYVLNGLGPTSTTHKVYYAISPTEISPTHSAWTELAAAEYEKLWASDDVRFSKGTTEYANYPMMLFRFKIDDDVKNVLKKIILGFEGYGSAHDGYGVTMKVWNDETSAWENAQTGASGSDDTITITLSTDLGRYVNSDGHLYFMARTTYYSKLLIAATLYCDYVYCTIHVNGIAYCDIASFRDLDQVRVKPFLWRTEFTVKTWLFENVSGD